MRAEARRILTRFLKAVEKKFPEGSALAKVPDLSPGQWRTIAATLAIYRAVIDEKMLEEDMRRPKISLSELSPPELREFCRGEVIDVAKERAG